MRRITFFSMIALLVISLISCDMLIGSDKDNSSVNTTGSTKSLEIVLKLNEHDVSKALTVESNTAPAKYTYTAICSTNPSAPGVQTTEKELEINDGTAKIKLVAGTWTITIFGYNSDGGLVVKGECKDKVLSSECKDVSINCTSANGEADSSVEFTIGAPKITDAQVEVHYVKFSSFAGSFPAAQKTFTIGEDGKDANGTKEGYVLYKDTMTIVPEDYIMQILYKKPAEAEAISGQVLFFKAVEKTPVKIKGNFDYGQYVSPDIDIEIDPTMLTVTLDNQDATGKTPRFKATISPNGVTNLTYMWFANGMILSDQTSDTLTWNPTNCGMYSITCIVSGKLHDKSISGVQYAMFTKDE